MSPTARQRTGRKTIPARGQSTAGRVTRAAIIGAAARVLVDEGYASFSLPSVAQKLGISHGNLNYYFPTRQALLETLIEHLLGKYHNRFVLMRNSAHTGATDATNSVGDLIDWLLDDAVSRRTNRLFRELWAMANHHRYIADALNRLQDDAVRQIIEALGGTVGGAATMQLEAASFLLAILVDGVTTSFGTRRRSDPRIRRVRQMAKEVLTALLEQASNTSRGASTTVGRRGA